MKQLRSRRLRRTSIAAAVLAAAVALVPAFGAAPSTAIAAGVGDCTPDAAWPANRQADADRVVALVNQHRASLGLAALKVSPTMTGAAVWKARHMAQYRYMAHDDPAPPVARTWYQRVQACGYSSGAGENIAYGYQSPEAVVQAWLNSSGHRANIESAYYKVIGVGAAGATTIYWAQNFGSYDDSGTPAPPPPPPSGDTTAPGAPPSLTATALSSSQASLAWGAATDNVGVTGYRVYRGGVQIGTTASRSWTDSGLTAGGTYSYTVRAYDAAGNVGPASAAATVTLPASAPPPSASKTVFPTSATITTGSLRAGLPSRLTVADGLTYDVYGSTAARKTEWYASLTAPNAATTLSVRYTGRASALCTQTLSIYDWGTGAWTTLDTRSSSSWLRTIQVAAPGNAGAYVSGTSGDGEIRVRIGCARSDGSVFWTGADLVSVTYS